MQIIGKNISDAIKAQSEDILQKVLKYEDKKGHLSYLMSDEESLLQQYLNPETGSVTKPQVIKLARLLRKIGVEEDIALKIHEQVMLAVKGLDIEYEIWKGKKLMEAFDLNNIQQSDNRNNNIQGSCMNPAKRKHLLEFYAYNPESISILVAKRGDKIVGRSILFKAFKTKTSFRSGQNDVTILGRIYSIDKKVKDSILKYAKDIADVYIDSDQQYDIKTLDTLRRRTFYVPLEQAAMNYYPYLDNRFRFINLKESYLSNSDIDYNIPYVEVRREPIGTFESNTINYRNPQVPDPHRPDEIYFEKKWEPKTKFIEVDGEFTLKENTFTCSHCKVLRHNRYKIYYSATSRCEKCIVQLPSTFFEKELTRKCINCEHYTPASYNRCFHCDYIEGGLDENR